MPDTDHWRTLWCVPHPAIVFIQNNCTSMPPYLYLIRTSAAALLFILSKNAKPAWSANAAGCHMEETVADEVCCAEKPTWCRDCAWDLFTVMPKQGLTGNYQHRRVDGKLLSDGHRMMWEMYALRWHQPQTLQPRITPANCEVDRMNGLHTYKDTYIERERDYLHFRQMTDIMLNAGLNDWMQYIFFEVWYFVVVYLHSK